jgi:hypothetical protein
MKQSGLIEQTGRAGAQASQLYRASGGHHPVMHGSVPAIRDAPGNHHGEHDQDHQSRQHTGPSARYAALAPAEYVIHDPHSKNVPTCAHDTTPA